MKRYERLVDRERKKLRDTLVIAGSFLAIGAVLAAAKQWTGALFCVMGIFLLFSLRAKRARLQAEIGKISNPEALEEELAQAQEFECFALILTESYAISRKPNFSVYPYGDMEKFEVGLAGDALKALFLTGKNGCRYRIAETRQGDGRQEDFDRAYAWVRNRWQEREKRKGEQQ